jgi:hypothetical protein
MTPTAQLRAAYPHGTIVEPGIHLRQCLIAIEPDVVRHAGQAHPRPSQIGPLLQRASNRGIHIDGDRIDPRRLDRIDCLLPEVRSAGIENERTQLILGPPDVGLRNDDRLFVPGDLGLGLDNVDGRHRPDFDTRAVVPQRLAG